MASMALWSSVNTAVTVSSAKTAARPIAPNSSIPALLS